MLHHGLADRRHHVAAQDDVLLHGRVSQIEITVFQALQLIGLAAAVDLEGKLVVTAFAENLNLLRDDLDVAGVLLRVGVGACAHGALHRDGGFLVDALHLGDQVLVLHNDLRCAVKITHNNKCEVAADHADVFHPAGNFHLLPDVFQPELITGVCSVLHTNFPSFS